MNHDEAPRFRIGTVASLTGVSVHLLRAWERRYAAVVPVRSEAGGRLYGQAEVDRVRRLKTLTEMGHSIGQLANLPDTELDKLIGSTPFTARRSPQTSTKLAVDRLLEGIEAMDTSAIEQSLSRASLVFEPLDLVTQVLVPALHEIGDRWEGGSLSAAQEHVATAAVRSQLGALLRLYRPGRSSHRAVATTPVGELHELGALAAALAAVSCGWHAVYLGPNLPAADIVRSATITRADAVLLSAVTQSSSLTEEVHRLRGDLPPNVALIVGGSGADACALMEGVLRLPTIPRLAEWLRAHRSNPAER